LCHSQANFAALPDEQLTALQDEIWADQLEAEQVATKVLAVAQLELVLILELTVWDCWKRVEPVLKPEEFLVLFGRLQAVQVLLVVGRLQAVRVAVDWTSRWSLLERE
jgi:hypothetical protein